MSPLMRSECRKFAPNIFNKTKCTNCFRQKEEHSAEALESNRATRKVCKCGYLFVAPDWDFSNPINRTKRWQRRWFVLYDDGELTYSVDEHPDTVPQAVISLLSTTGQGGGGIVWEAPESETGHPHSLAVAAPDRVHFVRGDTRDETRAWLASLLAVASPIPPQGTSRIRQARHKRNATFPGGRSNPLSMGVAQRVISGTAAVSRQHSPILRQRFNSCISPLHHALPLEVNEEDRISTNHSYSNKPVCKASSSASLSPTGSSEILLADNNTDDSYLSGSQSMIKLQVTGDTPISKSYFIGVDSSPSYCKDVEAVDAFIKSTQFHSDQNESCSILKNVADQEIKSPSVLKTFRSEINSIGIESPKCSPNTWRKQSSLLEESRTSFSINSPLEKTVRGDPDGCVLDSISTSSCSVEGSDHVDGISAEQTPMLSQANDEINCDGRVADVVEGHSGRDVSRQLPLQQQESIKHGWLMKLGSSKEWSKHWFVLRGSGLLYYRDPSAEGIGILDGVIDLGLVRDVRDATVERNHGLQLTTWDGKNCILSAVTPGIRTGWVSALRKAAGLSCTSPDHSSTSQLSSASLSISVTDNSGVVSSECSSDTATQVKSPLQSSRELSQILSLPVQVMLSSNSNQDITEPVQSTLESPIDRSHGMSVIPSQVSHKGQLSESTCNVLDHRQEKTSVIGSSLCKTNSGEVVVNSRLPQIVDCLRKDKSPSNGSVHIFSRSTEFSFEPRGLQEKNCANAPANPLSTTNVLVSESSQSVNDPSYVNVSYQGSGTRSTSHKPPMSPASFIPSFSRTVTRRNSASNCIRHAGSQTSDRGTAGVLILESNTSDCTRPERPSYLSLKSLSSSDSRESKLAANTGYAPISYISSSASSCSLSDEDFRTASEASLHSTPISEIMIDSNSNSIMWSKGEIVNERGESSTNYLPSEIGNDLGAILPPSPPLNRTPISRVKERARSRVIKRSKTPPEENLQAMKIDALTKRVKELVAALAAKEADLIKEKSKEVSCKAALKKRSVISLFENKSKESGLATSDGDCESIAVVRQNSEEEIGSRTICSQVLSDTNRMNDFEDNNNPSVTSVRRLSSSSSVAPHSLPRMGSLSDLTNVDLDLDLNTVDHERLIEEWCSLRARFEKAVREIHALRKELRACQGRVDALELESSATSMCLTGERKRAEADMSLMASRVQDLTVKLSAAEKQVRQLKQKTSRVESREKRRSLSLRGERDGRSGTDPSLGSGKLPKEISDRLTRLEACLEAALSQSNEKLVSSSAASNSAGSRKSSASCISKADEKKQLEDGKNRIVASSNQTVCKIGDSNGFKSAFTPTKSNVENLLLQTKPDDVTIIRNADLNVGGLSVKLDSKSPSSDNNKSGLEGCDEKEKTVFGESGKSGRKNPEVWTKVMENCSGSEQKRMRVQGRKQRLSSRLIKRASEEDISASSSPVGEGSSVVEDYAEEVRVEDESSKGCDPLRILVRLGSLEGRVSDYLKSSKKEKKLPLTNPTVVEFSVSENKSQEPERHNEELCPRCEDMRLSVERMKKELLLVNHGIRCRNEEQSLAKIENGATMVEKYREEIEQLRALCEKGMRAMDVSHQRLIKEMEDKHREEVVRVQIEKEQALREETKATLAALDAMRKAHETEVQREVAKFKEEFSRRMSTKQEMSTNHQVEMEGIRREILSLSQRYSSKCVECASLREQLRLAKGIKDKEQVSDCDAVAAMEALSGNS